MDAQKSILVDGNPCTLKEWIRTNRVDRDVEHIEKSEVIDVINLAPGQRLYIGLVEVQAALVNTKGTIMPASTADVCCVCGNPIPASDYRAGGLHSGFTYMTDGSRRYVERQAHLACSPINKPNASLLW